MLCRTPTRKSSIKSVRSFTALPRFYGYCHYPKKSRKMIRSRLQGKCEIYFCVCMFFLICGTGDVDAGCSQALTSLGFVVEYAVWRGWRQAIIQAPHVDAGCDWALLRLVKCLSVNGIASAVDVKKKAGTNSFLGVVMLAPELKGAAVKEFTLQLNQLIQWEMNTPSYDWLVMARSVEDFKTLSDILNATALRFDQNMVLGIADEKRSKNVGLCDKNFDYKNNARLWKNKPYDLLFNSVAENEYIFNNGNTESEISYYRSSQRFKSLARNRYYNKPEQSSPLLRSGIQSYNFSRTFAVINVSNFDLRSCMGNWIDANNINKTFFNVYLVQCIKVRINSTLYVQYLGAWSTVQSMSLVDIPYPVEARNFMGEKFIVGRRNSSEASDDDEPSAPELLDDILQFLSLRLNATSVTRYYGKLGFRTYEGAWTGLLGALMDHSVDMALEPVTAIAPRHTDMDFIFPIADTMCNIYIRHQETSAVRDIFLAPFSSKLIACVVCVALAAAVAVVVISRTTASSGDKRQMSCVEGIIWSTGILCQQGGTWTPQSPAASVLLIACLFFALVTYNAYAAFITSVLSVRVASVASLSDVLQSNMKIGYVRNGADQMYLMSTKDVQLNAFYIRGYSEAENLVSSAEEGLVRAARQDYAFFAGQRVARSTLSLLQLRSGAVLSRLEAALVPAMPQCTPPSGFASARAADVDTALFVILTGLLAGFLLGIGEYSWNKRRKYSRTLRKHFRRIFN